MRCERALVATDPLRFGRGRARHSAAADELGWGLSDDLRLFASTFAAGFLFVSILIG